MKDRQQQITNELLRCIKKNTTNENSGGSTNTSLLATEETLSDVLDELSNVQGLVTTDANETGTNTYTAPYRSLSVTALSNDVTINGVVIPEGLTRSSGSNDDEQQTADVTITGTSYYVTLVKNV